HRTWIARRPVNASARGEEAVNQMASGLIRITAHRPAARPSISSVAPSASLVMRYPAPAPLLKRVRVTVVDAGAMSWSRASVRAEPANLSFKRPAVIVETPDRARARERGCGGETSVGGAHRLRRALRGAQ